MPAPTWEEIERAGREDKEREAQGSLYVTNGLDPDTASNVVDLSERHGVDFEYAQRQREALEQADRRAREQEALRGSPATAEHFARPERAAVARDSILQMAEIERRLRGERGPGVLSRIISGFAKSPQAAEAGFEGVKAVPSATAYSLLESEVLQRPESGPSDIMGTTYKLVSAVLGDLTGHDIGDEMPTGIDVGPVRVEATTRSAFDHAVDEWLSSPSRRALTEQVRDAFGEDVRTRNARMEAAAPEVEGNIEAGITGGVQSFVQMLPALIAGAVTRSPNVAGAGMGLTVYGPEYVTARDEGMGVEGARNYAARQAAIETLTERFAAVPLFGKTADEMSFVERFVSFQMREQAGEQVATFTQDINAWLTLHPEKTLEDFIAERPDAAIQTAIATLVASGPTQATAELGNFIADRYREEETEQRAATMIRVRDEIEKAPVFERRRQDVREFVETATEGETLLLDGEGLNALYQTDSDAWLSLVDELELTEEQISDARLGLDVEVPAARVMTLEERSQFEQLLEITRMEPDLPTLQEVRAQADADASSVDIEAVREAFEAESMALVGFERVQQSVQRQLIDAGRSVEESEAAGAIWGAMFRVLEEDGVDTAQVFERLGLRIQGADQRVPREPRMDEPQSLLSFIREQGGVREQFGEGSGAESLNYMEGEMEAVYGVRIPGLINNESGVPIDELTRRAQDAGFDLADDQAFLNAVRAEADGEKVYRAEEGRAYLEYLNREAERDARDARGRTDVLTQAQSYNAGDALRREFMDAYVEESPVEGEVLSSRRYGFRISERYAVIVQVVPEEGGATVDWTFAHRAEQDAEPFEPGAEALTREETLNLFAGLDATLRTDVEKYGRDAYVFVPYTEALKGRYRRMASDLSDLGYGFYENPDTGDQYILHNDANIDDAGRIRPSGRPQPPSLPDDDPSPAEARAERFRKRLAARSPIPSDFGRSVRRGNLDTPSGGKTLFQMIGPKSKMADGQALKLAKKLRRQGATRQQIWDTTAEAGQPWYQNEDGEWISEVADGTIVVAEGEGALSQQIEYPVLFEAYPQLSKLKSDTRKRFDIFELGVSGFYDRGGLLRSRFLRVGGESELERVSATAHEAAHAIDHVEGRNMRRNKPYALQPTERRAFNTEYRRTWTMEERISVPPWKTEQEAINWFLGGRDLNAPRARFAKDGTYDPNDSIPVTVVEPWSAKDATMDNAPDERSDRRQQLGINPDFSGFEHSETIAVRGRQYLSLRELERDKTANFPDGMFADGDLDRDGFINGDVLFENQSDEVRRRVIAAAKEVSDIVNSDRGPDYAFEKILPGTTGQQVLNDLSKALTSEYASLNPGKDIIPILNKHGIYGMFFTPATRLETPMINSRGEIIPQPPKMQNILVLDVQAPAVPKNRDGKFYALTPEAAALEILEAQREAGNILMSQPMDPRRSNSKARATVQIPGALTDVPGAQILGAQDVVVSLTRAADKTSFLHESAHIFLEIYAALEGDNNAVAGRMADIRKWLKLKPGEKLTRDQHEKFAEAFEAYLMEGKSPNAELKGVFRRFRAWFASVYNELKRRLLLTQLNDEARDIFDRMLATSEEIDAARKEYSAGLNKRMIDIMTPEQVEKYQKHAEAARAVAEEKLFRKHVAEIKRRDKKAYKEDERRVRDEVETELMAEGVYRARNELGDDADLDMIAGDYGFTSGDALQSAMQTAPDFEAEAQRITRRRMRDLYGDMLTDGSAEYEAIAAVFNEPSIKAMEAEANALAAKAARDPVPLGGIRAAAKERINRARISEVITPGRYAIKARTLHRKAIQAAAREQWEDALRYTHQAMYAHELARGAYKAREELGSIQRFLGRYRGNRFPKKDTQKKMDPVFIEAIVDLMSLAGSDNQFARMASLRSFAATQAEAGIAIQLPSLVEADQTMPEIRGMSMDQLRELRDSVRNIARQGRANSEEARAAFSAEVREMTAEIEQAYTGTAKRETRNPTNLEKLSSWARSAEALFLRYPFLVEALQGGRDGKVVQSLEQGLRRQLTNRNARRHDLGKQLVELMNKHGITQKELKTTHQADVIEPGGVRFEQILALAMNMGTDSNRDRIAQDPSLGGIDAVDALLDAKLEKRHWDFAQDLWDLLETLWPEAKAVEQRVTGITPKKVEPRAFGAFGETYRGGYFPIAFDRGFLDNQDIEQSDAADLWTQAVNGMATSAATKKGFLKARQDNVERPVKLSLDTIVKHIDDVTNDIYMREETIKISRILRHPAFKHVLAETHGREYGRTLETVLKRTVHGTEQSNDTFERIFRGLRVNASVAILGFNVPTAMLAPISLFQTIIPRYGLRTALSGYGHFFAEGGMNLAAKQRFIMEKSEFMRERVDTLSREAHERIRNAKRQSTWNRFQGASYWMMSFVEIWSVSGPTWMGVYHDALANGKSEQDAITDADRAVALTQGSGLELDQSILQGGSEFSRALTFMWGYVSGYYGIVRNDIARKAGYRKAWPVVKHLLIMNIMASFAEALLRYAATDDEDEDPYLESVRDLYVRNIVGMVPGLSQAFNRYGGEVPAVAAGQGLVEAGRRWIATAQDAQETGELDGETAYSASRQSLRAIGIAVGFPGTVQLDRTIDTLIVDDDPTLRELVLTGADDDN